MDHQFSHSQESQGMSPLPVLIAGDEHEPPDNLDHLIETAVLSPEEVRALLDDLEPFDESFEGRK